MRILIISEYIAPLQAIASLRWTKIAKYIKIYHPETEITILTNQKFFEKTHQNGSFQRKDPLLEKDMQAFDEYLQFSNGFFAELYERIKKNGGQKLRQYALVNSYIPQKNWKTGIKKAAFSAVHDLRDYSLYLQAKSVLKKTADYDAVISTYGPAWPHRLAAHFKRQRPQVQWIADFRDPYAKDMDDPISYQRHKRFTMKYCAGVDKVLRVTEGLETHTPSAIPILTVPNGFDPAEKLTPVAPKKFAMVFTGLLYGEMRDIGIVCKVLRELCEEKKLNREDVEVSYAGPDGELALELARRYSAESFLHNYGVLSREKSLAMQQNAAILLQLNWNTKTEKCSWSGKMYEYMMAEKPIIYFVTGDVPYSEPSHEIYHLGGYCYEQCRHEETYLGMKNYILEKYQEWKATGNVSVKQEKDYIEQYSYPHIAEQVYRLFKKT